MVRSLTLGGEAVELGALMAQGAEALYSCSYRGKDAVVKERIPKAYRHPELEAQLTKSRFTQEVRCAARAQEVGVDTPNVLYSDPVQGIIVMEKIDGRPLREVFDDAALKPAEAIELGQALGRAVAKLHNANIIHGDLTTSNAMLRRDGALVLLDFGLSKVDLSAEEKAVDMYVLQRAFTSTHPDTEAVFDELLAAYLAALSDADREKVAKKFPKVQQRGRKKRPPPDAVAATAAASSS
ncbi:Protein kinase, putative [Hondaea fermentalgiana]|uniref:non-specific serine/threonine protein kinase n=1 Tax=Hondaea fermentalgiana TaxID=2315210 RepID=A0A2R5H2X4_9STRA|nr:Protein kinase, putative [Hondaea fermentalgiana]|eukprot:GBG34754.1 Protein kinase, putative [Hondaea fermentalgiana]